MSEEIECFEQPNLKGYSGIAARFKTEIGGTVIVIAGNKTALSECCKKITGKNLNEAKCGKLIAILPEGFDL